jgi:hypothetical protein
MQSRSRKSFFTIFGGAAERIGLISQESKTYFDFASGLVGAVGDYRWTTCAPGRENYRFYQAASNFIIEPVGRLLIWSTLAVIATRAYRVVQALRGNFRFSISFGKEESKALTTDLVLGEREITPELEAAAKLFLQNSGVRSRSPRRRLNCAFCGKIATQKCCEIGLYCDEECQQKDWVNHKNICEKK